MGKRSDFKRVERDFYPTPKKAVEPLVAHLKPCNFLEPCAGDHRLVNHLEDFGFTCDMASDIEPQSDLVCDKDAFDIENNMNRTIITNPPWDRKILHPMIDYFRSISPSTWLLFDADWMHTLQSANYMKYCKTVISIGRVKWIEDSTMTGKDNCVWYEFVQDETVTTFIGREPKQ